MVHEVVSEPAGPGRFEELEEQYRIEHRELGNFTGECKVRRAELKQLRGAWTDAREDLAGVSTADIDVWAAGTCAAYVRGDLDRLQGHFAEAEECFTEASRLGYRPAARTGTAAAGAGQRAGGRAMIRRCLAERRTTQAGGGPRRGPRSCWQWVSSKRPRKQPTGWPDLANRSSYTIV